jgi:hypothetical protein
VTTVPATLMRAATGLVAGATGPTAPATPTDPVGWTTLAVARRQLGDPTADPATDPPAGTTQTAAALVAGPAAMAAAPADDTANLQAQFDALRPRDTLTLQPITYQYSNDLYIRTSDVTINGNGATLQSTNPDLAALVIQANDVSVNNLSLTAPAGLPRSDGTNQTRLVFGGTGVNISDVNITGGASAGVYITGASNFQLNRVTVANTAADGIQITNGSNHGVLNNVTTIGTGDDAIAIVSYANGFPQFPPVSDIVVNSPVVSGSGQRGLVVTGGQGITFNNINVSDTALGAVWIGSQGAPFYTASASDIQVNGGTILRGNSGGLAGGAVTIFAQNAGQTVSNVTISDLNIVDTPFTSVTDIGIAAQGGTVNNIVLQNIAITQLLAFFPYPVYALGAPRSSYTATGFTMNGVPIVIP